MPVLVDREKTRIEIAMLALQIIGDEGFERLTVRRVAEVAGTSTAIVSNYFADKRDLILTAFEVIRERQKVVAAEAEARGLGVAGVVEAYLPMDQQRLQDWRAVIAFYGVALGDQELARWQSDRIAGAKARFERLLMHERGESRITTSISVEAERIVDSIIGVSIRFIFTSNPPVSARVRRRLVEQVLASKGA